MSNDEHNIRELAKTVDVKSFEAGVKYAQGLVRAHLNNTTAEDIGNEIANLLETDGILIPRRLVKAVCAVTHGVTEGIMGALLSSLERDSKWAVDKLTQYSHGVSDAHMTRLAAALSKEG